MKTFTKYHLIITRDQYHAEKAKGTYRSPHARKTLNILEIRPTYNLFSLLIERVGGPWNWTRRPCYSETKRARTEQRLKHPQTRLFLLRKEQKILGYCLSSSPEFGGSGSAYENDESQKVIEIENFGFFPEHTGKNYGRFFLPELFNILFKRYDAVYLSTRSTNHARVVPFYLGLGMTIIHQEILPDDLTPAPKKNAGRILLAGNEIDALSKAGK